MKQERVTGKDKGVEEGRELRDSSRSSVVIHCGQCTRMAVPTSLKSYHDACLT